MLYERTSSSTSLRFENQRRHKIRNLRAKVRSLLPEHICPREVKRKQKSNHFYSAVSSPTHLKNNSSSELDKRLHKEFQKLTLEELEEISSNKHYYLGSEISIAHFEQFIRTNHPQLINKEFAAPVVHQEDSSQLLFVPFSLLSRADFNSTKSLGSFKDIDNKRPYTSVSQHRRRHLQVKTPQNKRSMQETRMKAQSCQYRKNQIDQEVRVRRQMNWANIQRQQNIASAMKLNYIHQKVEQAKLWGNPNTFNRVQPQTNKKLVQKYQVAVLTSKLRKVCLKKSQKHQ